MRKVLATVSALVLGTFSVQPATADVVVELFTSQGCSSCPPADELLGQLAKRDDVIALSLHVDYWDYLGWKDEFANPAFTLRQRRYAAAAESSMIYTPQMVIGGVDHIVGTKGMELADQIMRHKNLPERVSITATQEGGIVMIKAMTMARAPKQMIVQLVRYSPSETVAIRRGENAGRDITYHNVVQEWTKIADWSGDAPLEMDASLEGEQPGVVIIQDGESGPIIAASKID